MVPNDGYEIYGMVIFQGDILYLVYDKFDMPMWYSSELFRVDDSKVPGNWYYKFFGYDDRGITALWGYEELVNTDKHYNGLAEQNEEDVNLFRDKFTSE